MTDFFRELTRGVSFNKEKFNEDAKKFGLVDAKPENQKPKDKIQLDVESEESEAEEDAEEQILDEPALMSGRSKRKAKKPAVDKAAKSKLKRIEKVNQFRNQNRLHVHGSDVPEPLDGWQRLAEAHGVNTELVEALSRRYSEPTPVQMQAIPIMLARREILACAPTGSGKTAAYLVPVIHSLRETKAKGLKAIVIAPTRELARQIHEEANALGHGLTVKVLDAVSGKKKKPVNPKLCDLLISTPNRLVYFLKETENLKNLRWLVIDESDKLFEAGANGFREQLAVIYSACAVGSSDLRRAMFSATLAPDVENWCTLNLDSPISVWVGARNTAQTNVDQQLVYTGSEKGKLMAFKHMIDEGLKPPVLVFVQTKERATELLGQLPKDLRAACIHSGLSTLQRDTAVRSFRAGRIWVLICTELLGRGIDFKGVNLVVNYDFPPSTVSYIHRIGRTGRAGRVGRAVTFFTDADKTLLRSIASVIRESGGQVPDYMFSLKKASRQEKRQLAKSDVKRDKINGESRWEEVKRKKKEEMIAASKRRKRQREQVNDETVVEKVKKNKRKKKIM